MLHTEACGFTALHIAMEIGPSHHLTGTGGSPVRPWGARRMVSEDSGLRQSFLLIVCTGHIVTARERE